MMNFDMGWQEHCDHEAMAGYDSVRERYGDSAIDHALEAAHDAVVDLERATERLRRGCPTLTEGEAVAAVRALWAMPLDPLGQFGLYDRGTVAERTKKLAEKRRFAAAAAGELGDDDIPF